MPEVHLPQLDEEARPTPAPAQLQTAQAAPAAVHSVLRSKTVLKLGLEVVLISAGVFLGMMADQWRQRTEQREIAEASLRRLRVEVQANQQAIKEVTSYHTEIKKSIDVYLLEDEKTRKMPPMLGLNPAPLEHTAWDLALVTQSLAHIDADLALAFSSIYRIQGEYREMENEIMLATLIRTPSRDLQGWFAAVSMYFGDINEREPQLLALYDTVLPKIDRALGEPATK